MSTAAAGAVEMLSYVFENGISSKVLAFVTFSLLVVLTKSGRTARPVQFKDRSQLTTLA